MSIVFSRVVLVKEKEIPYDAQIITPDDAYRVIIQNTLVWQEAQEVFGFLALNNRNTVTAIHEVSRGTINHAPANPREVFKAAILYNAASIILFHNHPSGDTEPSIEDLKITEEIKKAGELLGIKVLDHIIVGDGKYRSLKAEKLM